MHTRRDAQPRLASCPSSPWLCGLPAPHLTAKAATRRRRSTDPGGSSAAWSSSSLYSRSSAVFCVPANTNDTNKAEDTTWSHSAAGRKKGVAARVCSQSFTKLCQEGGRVEALHLSGTPAQLLRQQRFAAMHIDSPERRSKPATPGTARQRIRTCSADSGSLK